MPVDSIKYLLGVLTGQTPFDLMETLTHAVAIANWIVTAFKNSTAAGVQAPPADLQAGLEHLLQPSAQGVLDSAFLKVLLNLLMKFISEKLDQA